MKRTCLQAPRTAGIVPPFTNSKAIIAGETGATGKYFGHSLLLASQNVDREHAARLDHRRD